MIILRQKDFTRAEKQAFLKLYRMTKGFKVLPKGSSPRDALRFNRFAVDMRDLSLGHTDNFDIENAKTLIKNIGIDDPELVERALKKYTNKRALVRLRKQADTRIKNRINGGNWSPSQIKESRHLHNIQNSGADEHDKSKEIFDRLHELVNKQDNSNVIQNQLRNQKIQDLTNFANNKGIMVQRGDGQFAHGVYDSYVTTAADMSRTVPGNNGQNYYGVVDLAPGALEGDLAHEIGHVRTFMGPTGRDLKWARHYAGKRPRLYRVSDHGKLYINDKNQALQEISDQMVTVANENSANVYGRALLNRSGFDQRRRQISNGGMKASIGDYLGIAKNHGAALLMDSIH